jgi:hypothetical protein
MKRQLQALGAVLANDRIKRADIIFKGAEVGEGRRMQKKVGREQRNQARDLTWCSWFERNNPDFNTSSRWPKSLLSSDFVYHTHL